MINSPSLLGPASTPALPAEADTNVSLNLDGQSWDLPPQLPSLCYTAILPEARYRTSPSFYSGGHDVFGQLFLHPPAPKDGIFVLGPGVYLIYIISENTASVHYHRLCGMVPSMQALHAYDASPPPSMRSVISVRDDVELAQEIEAGQRRTDLLRSCSYV